MRIKRDDNLIRFVWDLDDNVLGGSLLRLIHCSMFIKAGMLQDVPESYGATMRELLGDRNSADVCKIIEDCLKTPVTIEMFADFLNLTVIGDKNCPACGGELKFVETEGHELHDGTHDVPNSYIIDNYIYTCPVCGEIFKSDKQL